MVHSSSQRATLPLVAKFFTIAAVLVSTALPLLPQTSGGPLIVNGKPYQTVASALTALPASGGHIELPDGYTETLASDLFITSSNVCIAAKGTATLVLGPHQIRVMAGADGFCLAGTVPWGWSINNNHHGFLIAGYTGDDAAVVVGGPGAQTFHVRIADVYLSSFSAGGKSAGLRLVNCNACQIERMAWNGRHASTQVGINLTATKGMWSGKVAVKDPHILTSGGIGILLDGAGAVNATSIEGGYIVGGGTDAIKIACTLCGGNSGAHVNIEDFTRALTFSQQTFHNRFVGMTFERNAADVVFDSGTGFNVVEAVSGTSGPGTPLKFSDANQPTTNVIWSSGSLVSGSLDMPGLKAKSGTRFLCIDSNGRVVSSARPCSGT